jgi:hypothetical protein
MSNLEITPSPSDEKHLDGDEKHVTVPYLDATVPDDSALEDGNAPLGKVTGECCSGFWALVRRVEPRTCTRVYG